MRVRADGKLKIGSAPNAVKPKPGGEEKPTGERNPGNIGLKNRIDPVKLPIKNWLCPKTITSCAHDLRPEGPERNSHDREVVGREAIKTN